MTMNDFLKELEIYTKDFKPEVLEFYNELKEKSKSTFTEKGKKILVCMKENEEKYSNSFNAKLIGELLFMPPRSVSGAVKKLLNEGYVSKKGTNPVSYEITDLGRGIKVDNE